MLTLLQTTKTILHWTASCMNELHLEGILIAFENCVRKPFEDNTNTAVISRCEAMILGAIEVRKIQLDSQSMGGISQVVANDLHKMD